MERRDILSRQKLPEKKDRGGFNMRCKYVPPKIAANGIICYSLTLTPYGTRREY